MRRTIVFVTMMMLLIGFSTIAFAQDYPEIRGMWVGQAKAVDLNGQITTKKIACIIKKQSGAMFSGTNLWFVETSKNAKKEKICGIIGEDLTTIVATGEGKGRIFGYFRSPQSLEIFSLTSGSKARAERYSLSRIRVTKGFVEIDKDGDKTIIRSEITNIYPLNADIILKEADRNKDGKLSKSEWENWKKQNK